MITDSFFHQGDAHEVCEDYALHGSNYVIVSDGCSNGGGPRIDTDWGSRILSKVAERCIETMELSAEFTENVGSTAELRAMGLGLADECLTATLLCLRKDPDLFRFYSMGDGFLGVRTREGVWEIYQIEFESGAPLYLKYLMDGEVEYYLDEYGPEFKINFWQISDGTVISEESQDMKVNIKYPWYCPEFPTSMYDTAFIASDGMASFHEIVETPTSRHTEPVKPIDAIKVMLDILDYRPGFMRLQRNWAFKQKRKGTYLSRNWRPSDDVSMGMIHENA